MLNVAIVLLAFYLCYVAGQVIALWASTWCWQYCFQTSCQSCEERKSSYLFREAVCCFCCWYFV